jgi:hypothetical protein
MKTKIKTLLLFLLLCHIAWVLSACVTESLEPAASTQKSATQVDPHSTAQLSPEDTPASPTEAIQTTPTELGEPDWGGKPANANTYGWMEMQEPHFGLRFAMPCYWYFDYPEKIGTGQAYYLRNYSIEYAMSFPADVDDMWERGGIKIDIVFAKRIHPSITMLDYVNRPQGENPDYKVTSIEEMVINNQEALLVTGESSTFGVWPYYLFTVSDEAFMVFTPSPGAIQNPDVQAILNSITFDPDFEIDLPDFSPSTLIEGVVSDCKGANCIKAMLSGPTSISWGSGEAVKIQFALVNVTEQDLYVLNWLTPFEGFGGDIFRVTHNGAPVPYQGPLAFRGDPTPDSYILIEARGAKMIEVNLSQVYDFSRTGIYTIAFKSPHSSSIARSEADFATTVDELSPVPIPSNEISIEIE